MSPKLQAMLYGVGAVILGGVAFSLYTPIPAARTMAELRDAGITDGQKFVLVCPERLTPKAKKRIASGQPGQLRPRQRYADVARVAVCFDATDAGQACFKADGSPRVASGGIVVPSLRRDLSGLDADAGDDLDGGEDSVDDSWQHSPDACRAERCATFDAGAGNMPATAFCSRLNRLWLVPQPCAIPNCWVGDGGAWVDDATPNCKGTGPLGGKDGGPRFRGCNVLPAQYSTGPDCLPSACEVVAGDNPFEDL